MFRVGVVESSSTPTTVSPPHRPNSFTGETSGAAAAANNESRRQDRPSTSDAIGVSGEARARTGLNLPVSEVTRSSYMTTSTGSRMSGLSDFPVPPKDHHDRMSFGTYFNEPLPPPPTEQQLIFGRDEDAGELAKTLSSSL